MMDLGMLLASFRETSLWVAMPSLVYIKRCLGVVYYTSVSL